jgi:hypothetical protein
LREAVLGRSVRLQETGDLHTLAATLLNVENNVKQKSWEK